MRKSLPTIVVFDSGVGGLSILSSLRDGMSGNFVFVSDNGFFPYGEKDAASLLARVEDVTDRIIAAFRPDLLVVACNTASTVVLPRMRSRYSTPFVGVVPAIKPAALRSRARSIGLLATPATVSRPYTEMLIQDFASDCRVYRRGSTVLVRLAEEKLRGQPVNEAEIAAELKDIFDKSHADGQRIDTVVLGCTHFPLLLDELKAVAPWPVDWIDSSDAIARRVKEVLSSQSRFVEAGEGNATRAVFTADHPSVLELTDTLEKFAGCPRHNIVLLDEKWSRPNKP